MSADRLRQAAWKIRETARDASRGEPWEAFRQHTREGFDFIGVGCGGRDDIFTDPSCRPEDATHIAMWSPLVAHDVATLLTMVAVHVDPDEMSRAESEIYFAASDLAGDILCEDS